ncbi:hypothetical protein RFI_29575, partial [Reticulomyxa filosa]
EPKKRVSIDKPLAKNDRKTMKPIKLTDQNDEQSFKSATARKHKKCPSLTHSLLSPVGGHLSKRRKISPLPLSSSDVQSDSIVSSKKAISSGSQRRIVPTPCHDSEDEGCQRNETLISIGYEEKNEGNHNDNSHSSSTITTKTTVYYRDGFVDDLAHDRLNYKLVDAFKKGVTDVNAWNTWYSQLQKEDDVNKNNDTHIPCANAAFSNWLSISNTITPTSGKSITTMHSISPASLESHGTNSVCFIAFFFWDTYKRVIDYYFLFATVKQNEQCLEVTTPQQKSAKMDARCDTLIIDNQTYEALDHPKPQKSYRKSSLSTLPTLQIKNMELPKNRRLIENFDQLVVKNSPKKKRPSVLNQLFK